VLQTAVLVATPAALAEVLSAPQPQEVLRAARFLVIDEVDACLTVRRHWQPLSAPTPSAGLMQGSCWQKCPRRNLKAFNVDATI
jgi:hypothetical protein